MSAVNFSGFGNLFIAVPVINFGIYGAIGYYFFRRDVVGILAGGGLSVAALYVAAKNENNVVGKTAAYTQMPGLFIASQLLGMK